MPSVLERLDLGRGSLPRGRPEQDIVVCLTDKRRVQVNETDALVSDVAPQNV